MNHHAADKFVAHYRLDDDAIQDVWSHLENVAKRTAAIADKVGLANVGELLGLVHDVGKASSDFNNYIRHAVGLPLEEFSKPEDVKGSVDHSTAGSLWLRSKLLNGEMVNFSSQLMPLIVASHHSGLIDCLTVDGQNGFEHRLNKVEAQSHMIESLSNAPVDYIERINDIVSDGSIGYQLEDCIRSLQEPHDTMSEVTFKMGLLTRFLFSALIDGDRVDTIDFQDLTQEALRRDGNYQPWELMISSLESHLKSFSCQNLVDRFRQDVAQRCLQVSCKNQGIYRLTVPTGGGKTLASLRFSLHHAQHHQLERIIYVIPCTSIIDQNAKT
ncbi:MAG: CRISPR-associated endonuclease Cas3'', partial [Firmicutes bacterium]|nr:CRISPR-associated endonuclease Cas3'' [Bacillota bacterium]